MLEVVKSFLSPAAAPSQSGLVQGEYYERDGSCHQCGQCCSNIYLVYGQQTINSLQMFEEIKGKNPEYQAFKPLVQESDEQGILFQCTHLQTDNTCGIYEDRPLFCRAYPSEHSLLMGGQLANDCGYRFRLKKTFGEVLKQHFEQSQELLSLKKE